TVPKDRVFNVTLGTFLPDLELVQIVFGSEPLNVPEANLKGYNVQEHVFPNGSKTFTLQVPFEDPNVKQKVTPPDTRTYILPLTYLLNIVPENTPFTHPAVVEAVLKDINCFTNETMAALAVKVESVPSLSPNQLTLRDPSCRPLQSDAINAVFYFNVNSCGTTRRVSIDTCEIIFEEGQHVDKGWPQHPDSLLAGAWLRVACHYLVNDTKVVQFLYQNNPAPGVQPGLGDLEVIMRLALDSTYNDLYGAEDYPVVKYLRRPLYFEVELLYSRDPQAELFLENCWATYSADRTSSPKWDVVVDSCENSADEYLTIFHPVSSNARVLFPSHLKRFEVKMFSFTSGQDALKGQIYFHCSVVICDSHRPSDSLCSRLCIPGKRRLGKSSVWGGEVGGFCMYLSSLIELLLQVAVLKGWMVVL
ncbi:ZP2 protein, partial [Polyodon spathula]|nr:ZP2 protein [Polyodon spathula]